MQLCVSKFEMCSTRRHGIDQNLCLDWANALTKLKVERLELCDGYISCTTTQLPSMLSHESADTSGGQCCTVDVETFHGYVTDNLMMRNDRRFYIRPELSHSFHLGAFEKHYHRSRIKLMWLYTSRTCYHTGCFLKTVVNLRNGI